MVLVTKTSVLIVVLIAWTLFQAGCVRNLVNWRPGILSAEKKDQSQVQTKSSDSGDKKGKKSDGTGGLSASATQDRPASASSQESTRPRESREKTGAQAAVHKEDLKTTSGAAPTKDKPPAESDDDPDRLPMTDETGKRHDHTGYLVMIKNRAAELVNKDPACTYARICRQSITDEWSVTLFFQEGKTFRFVTYGWDPVDEKWEQSYASEKRPVAQMEEHAKFTAAGKECTVLKKARR
jgi:hypothetical protein